MARMFFHPPSAARVAEGREHEFRFLERTVAVAERSPHAVFSEPDDVRPHGSRPVTHKARMPFHPPSATRVAEGPEPDFRCLEGSVPVAARGPHAVFFFL